jgi:hypothetical protein
MTTTTTKMDELHALVKQRLGYGPKNEMPDGEQPTEEMVCPHCNTVIQYFTYFRCEPTDALTMCHGVENYEEEDNLDPDVAVRCDHCAEFLPSRFYEPLWIKLCAAATEEEDDDTDDATHPGV